MATWTIDCFFQVSQAKTRHPPLGIHPNQLSRWKKEFEGDNSDNENAASSVTLRAELNRLRKENKQLKMEREILKKAAAFFAREQK